MVEITNVLSLGDGNLTELNLGIKYKLGLISNVINPWRMRRRVTVVILCVCVCVCPSVCLLPL